MNIEPHQMFLKFCFPDPGRKINHEIHQRIPLTEKQTKIYNLACVGWKAAQISNRTNIPLSGVYDALQKIRHNGYKY